VVQGVKTDVAAGTAGYILYKLIVAGLTFGMWWLWYFSNALIY
jgi:hypothetical protein